MTEHRTASSYSISAPNFESHHIHRPRLVDRLLVAPGIRVALIVASAGYGKTTLLSDYHRLSADPVCWLRLSESDRDLFSLASLAWDSIERRFHRLRGDLDINRMDGMAPRAIGRRIGEAVSGKVSERFAFVVEDLHLLEGDDSALRLMQALIDELPEDAFILMSSRTVPNLGLVDLIARDQLITIGAEELAFDRAELRRLVQIRTGEEPDEALLTTLMNETGGWVTGVLLSERLLDPNSLPLDNGQEPMSFEYLADHAFGRVSNDLQQFMLLSSILPFMTAQICDKLLEREDSDQVLEKLVRRGLFTSVTLSEPRTYEYHHALSKFLRARASSRLSSNRRSRLALKAARILESEGQEYAALKILLNAGFEQEAVALGEDCSLTLFETGNTAQMRRLGMLFVDAGVPAPQVFVRIANSIGIVGPAFEASKWIALAEDVSESLDDPDKWYIEESKAVRAANSGDLEALRSSVSRLKRLGNPECVREMVYLARACADLKAIEGDRRGCLSILQEAMAKIEGEGASRRGSAILDPRDQRYLGLLHVSLSAAFAAEGRFDDSVIVSKRAVELMEPSGLRSLLVPLNNLACSLYHSGRYRESLATFERAIDLSDDFEACYGRRAYCYCGYGEFLSDLGRFRKSLTFFERALSCAHSIGDTFLKRHIDGQIRLLIYRCPELDDPRHSHPVEDPIDPRLTPNVLTNHILKADLGSNPTDILRHLERLEGTVSLNRIDKALLGMWRVISLSRLNDADNSLREFKKVLHCAFHDGTMHQVATYLRHESTELRGRLLSATDGEPGSSRLQSLLKRMEEVGSLDPSRAATSRGMQPEAQVYVLGSCQALVRGENIKLRPLHFEILSYLLVAGRSSSDRIGDVFWPGVGRREFSGRLYTAIYSIRQAFGRDSIKSAAGWYEVDNRRIACDAVRFRSLALESQRDFLDTFDQDATIDEALEMYKGPFSPSCHSGWAIEKRRELVRLHLDLLERRAERSIQRGRPHQAVEDLNLILRTDPLRDRANSLYLKALCDLGRRGEMVRHFKLAALIYREELAIDPPALLVNQYRALAT